MQKLIFIDKNEKLVKKVKKLFKKYENENNAHLSLSTMCGDAIVFQKENPSWKLATASNPKFEMGGGLDGAIREAYKEEIEEGIYENKKMKSLLPIVSVGEDRIATESLILRALGLVYFATRNSDIILTGIGTSIGGFSEKKFLELLERLLNANFSSANFSYADFRSANFSSADFRSANFSYADFRSANFSYADFSSANFSYANFLSANFLYANFSSADFLSANFSSANFSYAKFRSADFSYANFRSADFSYADFSSADFRSADFSSANFSSADFRSADFLSANFSSANFSYADFSYAKFSSANFLSANFISANFSSANFSYANFSSANFSYADFSSANFLSANFRSANFLSADFSSANFSYADFSYANFSSANFSYAKFSSANFLSANFISANFLSADFSSANFSSANFLYANLRSIIGKPKINECTIGLSLVCPEEGAFIAWKKANGNIVKLLIPENALRSSATTRKCRASEAKVLAIFDVDGNNIEETVSSWDKTFKYTVGETVKPKEEFDTDRWNECASGIHFFITRYEAECY